MARFTRPACVCGPHKRGKQQACDRIRAMNFAILAALPAF